MDYALGANTISDNTGGFLTPPSRPAEFAMRVTTVKGGFLINKFSTGSMEVCVTLDEAKAIVDAYFIESFSLAQPNESVAGDPQIQEAGEGLPA